MIFIIIILSAVVVVQLISYKKLKMQKQFWYEVAQEYSRKLTTNGL